MSSTELNRREIICGAGALATGGAMPAILTAGSLLTPQVASAATSMMYTSDSPFGSGIINNFSTTVVIGGQKFMLVIYRCTNQDFAIVRPVDASGRTGNVIHMQRSHLVAGQRVLSLYKSCTVASPKAGEIFITVPTPHHRQLNTSLLQDVNNNGEVDWRPNVVYPTVTRFSETFDSKIDWKFDCLMYKTYVFGNVENLQGALKRGASGKMVNADGVDWLGFKVQGAARREGMDLIRKFRAAHDAGTALIGGTTFSAIFSVGALLVGAAAAVASANPMAVVALGTMGVLASVNTSAQAQNAFVKVEEARTNFVNLQNWVLEQPNLIYYSKP